MTYDYNGLIEKNFPFSSPREQQRIAIEKALKSFIEGNKRFFILDAGTGVGKSAIGLTIATALNELLGPAEGFKKGAYYLTTQKILQQQYMKDFSCTSHGMLDLKSATNYTCSYTKTTSCGESMRSLKVAPKGSEFFSHCMNKCVYKRAKQNFIDGKNGITNFSYFFAETKYSGKLEPRDVLVVDEAHNIEEELSKFVEVSITESFATKVLKQNIPTFNTQHQVFSWIKNEYTPAAALYLAEIEAKIESAVVAVKRLEEFELLARQVEVVDKHVCKMKRFIEMYDEDNWVFNDVEASHGAGRRLEFKPIDISGYSQDLLFRHGRKVILMSATILNKDAFCEGAGINPSEADFLSMPSPFPVENRPIIYSPIGKMNAAEIDSTLPKMAQAVKAILEQHAGDKGIIHAHSFKVAAYIKKALRSSRILIHDSSNREEVLAEHIASKRPTVLISPSMAEGVDLKDDASRFQIICKVPYPYLGDKLVKKRMHKWKWWYPLQTAKKIVQSVGRSIRNEKDHAVTYILDADWGYFYSKNKEMFPESFKESLK